MYIAHRLASLLAVATVAIAACSSDEVDPLGDQQPSWRSDGAQPGPGSLETISGVDIELVDVFASYLQSDAAGEPVVVQVDGNLTPAQRQQVARPYRFLDKDTHIVSRRQPR